MCRSTARVQPAKMVLLTIMQGSQLKTRMIVKDTLFFYRKSGFDHEMNKITRPLPLDRLTGSIMEIIGSVKAEEVREETKFYITSGKQRGIPTKLASIMDISRQTIEKTIKAGNIYTARNMAITAINEMTNIRRER